MSVEGIKDTLHRQPFQPFIIRMVSGKEYRLEHPDFIAASPSYRRLYVVSEDRMEILDTLLIESIETVAAA